MNASTQKRLWIWIILCMMGCISLGSNVYAATDQETVMKQLSDGNNAFAYNLYANLRQAEGNLFFSPYSISTALTMTYAGARGETEMQMAAALHFTLDQAALHPAFADLAKHFRNVQKKGKIALTIANALWIQQDFELLKPFLQLTKKHYDANLFQVNFKQEYEKVRTKINAWVAKQTKDKIKDLLAPGTLNELTRLVLTNAIYFKGNWAQQFDQDQTLDEPFWLTPDKSTDVPLMRQQNSFEYGENDLLQILELPYAGEDLEMVILLPRAKDGLAQLEAKLSVEQVAPWLATVSLREVDVSLPKFTLTAQFNLSAALKALGMELAFADKADFSGLTSQTQLSITDVIHKAFVEVNEEGTEAAAATAVVVGVTAVMEPHPVPVFKADHPFVFFIRDKTSNSILFLGRVLNLAQ